MSKASEEYVEVHERVKSAPHALMEAISTGAGEYPHLKQYMTFASLRLVPAVLRAGKYHFAGAPPWPDGHTALQETMEHLDRDLKMLQLRHFAAGVMAGQMDECDFSDSSFESAVMEQVITFVEDPDLANQILSNIPQIMASAVRTTHFEQSTGKETAHVWDLWHSVLKSNIVDLYITGVKLGQRWRDEEILNGILQVTNDEGER